MELPARIRSDFDRRKRDVKVNNEGFICPRREKAKETQDMELDIDRYQHKRNHFYTGDNEVFI